MKTFKAMVVEEVGDGVLSSLKEWALTDLQEGEVLIKVAYSSINYKDMLAFKPKGGVLARYPMIPGVDMCGEVVCSDSKTFQKGQKVLATGFQLGTSHMGGYAQYARIPHSWLIPLPPKLSLKESMIIGTAGFTAALSLNALELMGMNKSTQPSLVVTGATGGVGSMAIALLSASGYKNITALSSKTDQKEWLLSLGAQDVLHPQEILESNKKPLNKQRFHYVLDCVGGDIAQALISQIHYGGSMTLCGNANGIHLQSNVLPFILRGINLLGIDSVHYPLQKRYAIWERFAQEWRIFDRLKVQEVSLENLSPTLESLQKGTHIGRSIVKIP